MTRHALVVRGYCLMSNRVHLDAPQEEESSCAMDIGRTHFAYAQYANRLHGRWGYLWPNRYFSRAPGEDRPWAALEWRARLGSPVVQRGGAHGALCKTAGNPKPNKIGGCPLLSKLLTLLLLISLQLIVFKLLYRVTQLLAA